MQQATAKLCAANPLNHFSSVPFFGLSNFYLPLINGLSRTFATQFGLQGSCYVNRCIMIIFLDELRGLPPKKANH